MESWGEYTARNRQTGSIITLVDNRDGSFEDMGEDIGGDPERTKELAKDGSWATVCDTHSTYVLHPTRAAAYSSFVTPWDWCEECDKCSPPPDRRPHDD